jgi:hypothetical protein
MWKRPIWYMNTRVEDVWWDMRRDLCKTPSFARFLRQTQILILEILNVFLRLKFSSSPDYGTCSLDSNKIEHFSKVSRHQELVSVQQSALSHLQ